jgi:hypothetical protein
VVIRRRIFILNFMHICREWYSVKVQSTRTQNKDKNNHNNHNNHNNFFLFFWRDSPNWARSSSFTTFLDHKQRRTTFGRTPLDEWSARRRGLYLTTHKIHYRQKDMHPVGSESHNLSRRAAAYLLLRPLGHWGRRFLSLGKKNNPKLNSPGLKNRDLKFTFPYWYRARSSGML